MVWFTPISVVDCRGSLQYNRRNGQQAVVHSNRSGFGSLQYQGLTAGKGKLTAALFFSCLRGFSSKAAVVQCPPFYPEPAPTASAAASTAAVVQSPPGNPAFLSDQNARPRFRQVVSAGGDNMEDIVTKSNFCCSLRPTTVQRHKKSR